MKVLVEVDGIGSLFRYAFLDQLSLGNECDSDAAENILKQIVVASTTRHEETDTTWSIPLSYPHRPPESSCGMPFPSGFAMVRPEELTFEPA